MARRVNSRAAVCRWDRRAASLPAPESRWDRRAASLPAPESSPLCPFRSGCGAATKAPSAALRRRPLSPRGAEKSAPIAVYLTAFLLLCFGTARADGYLFVQPRESAVCPRRAMGALDALSPQARESAAPCTLSSSAGEGCPMHSLLKRGRVLPRLASARRAPSIRCPLSSAAPAFMEARCMPCAAKPLPEVSLSPFLLAPTPPSRRLTHPPHPLHSADPPPLPTPPHPPPRRDDARDDRGDLPLLHRARRRRPHHHQPADR
jgi:hypothetical protein